MKPRCNICGSQDVQETMLCNKCGSGQVSYQKIQVDDTPPALTPSENDEHTFILNTADVWLRTDKGLINIHDRPDRLIIVVTDENNLHDDILAECEVLA
jgi:hypothetical protein